TAPGAYSAGIDGGCYVFRLQGDMRAVPIFTQWSGVQGIIGDVQGSARGHGDRAAIAGQGSGAATSGGDGNSAAGPGAQVAVRIAGSDADGAAVAQLAAGGGKSQRPGRGNRHHLGCAHRNRAAGQVAVAITGAVSGEAHLPAQAEPDGPLLCPSRARLPRTDILPCPVVPDSTVSDAPLPANGSRWSEAGSVNRVTSRPELMLKELALTEICCAAE